MNYTLLDKGKAIRCETCKRTSWNPSDVKQLYCGWCHKFHV